MWAHHCVRHREICSVPRDMMNPVRRMSEDKTHLAGDAGGDPARPKTPSDQRTIAESPKAAANQYVLKRGEISSDRINDVTERKPDESTVLIGDQGSGGTPAEPPPRRHTIPRI